MKAPVCGRLWRLGCRETGRENHPGKTNGLALPGKPAPAKAPKPPAVRPPRQPGFPAPRQVAPAQGEPVANDTWRCQYFTGPGLSEADKCGANRIHNGRRESPYCALHTALCSNGHPPQRTREPGARRLQSQHFW